MPIYRYKARDYNGHLIEGELEALNKKNLEFKLDAMEYILLSADSRRGFLNNDIFSLFRKINSKELVQFSVQLSTLINSGISILGAIEILETQVRTGNLRKCISRIKLSLNEGKSLSESLEEQPEVFSGLYVGLVKSGEASGELEEVLVNLGKYLEVSENNRAKLKSALVYPGIMAGFSVLTVVFLVTFILPKFVEIFDGNQAMLPIGTRILLGTSVFIREKWYAVIFLLISLAAGLRAMILTKIGGYYFDLFKLRMPIFGPIITKTIISRFCRTFGILMRSSVPMLYALDTLRSAVGNQIIAETVDGIKETVTRGGEVHEEVERSEFFPLMVSRMIAVGESTGSLDKMLFKISDFYDSELESEIKAVTSTVEPILIMVLGLVIGGIVLSVMTPMFDMAKVMRG